MILFCIALHRIEGMIGCVEMRAPAHYWPFRTVGGQAALPCSFSPDYHDDDDDDEAKHHQNTSQRVNT